MAMRMQIVIKKDEFTPLMKTLGSRKVQKAIGDAGNEIALKVKDNLVVASSKWRSITRSISVSRRGNQNRVNIIGKGIMLDSMTPHYVALKPGRAITKWVNAKGHLNMKHGKSKVYWSKNRNARWSKGGVKSALYVTPTPWIEKPLKKGIRSTRRIVSRHINRLLRQAKVGG